MGILSFSNHNCKLQKCKNAPKITNCKFLLSENEFLDYYKIEIKSRYQDIEKNDKNSMNFEEWNDNWQNPEKWIVILCVILKMNLNVSKKSIDFL